MVARIAILWFVGLLITFLIIFVMNRQEQRALGIAFSKTVVAALASAAIIMLVVLFDSIV